MLLTKDKLIPLHTRAYSFRGKHMHIQVIKLSIKLVPVHVRKYIHVFLFSYILLVFCRYIEDHHNCFDFVIFFLKQVGFSRQNLSAESRSALTHDIILPQMSKVVQYITLYRNIASFSYVCQDVQTKSLMKK